MVGKQDLTKLHASLRCFRVRTLIYLSIPEYAISLAFGTHPLAKAGFRARSLDNHMLPLVQSSLFFWNIISIRRKAKRSAADNGTVTRSVLRLDRMERFTLSLLILICMMDDINGLHASHDHPLLLYPRLRHIQESRFFWSNCSTSSN